jgi:hypothetical protein
LYAERIAFGCGYIGDFPFATDEFPVGEKVMAETLDILRDNRIKSGVVDHGGAPS